jgi:hypothetical protein
MTFGAMSTLRQSACHEALRTLHAVKADKAPGPDGITNRVLQATVGV